MVIKRIVFLLGFSMALSSAASTALACGRPASDSKVILRLHDAEGRVTTVTVGAGGMATITKEGMATLCLRPANPADGQLVISASLVWDASDKASLEATATALPPLQQGSLVHLDQGGYSMDIEWVSTDATQGYLTDGGPSTECCVVCEEIKTCACRVEAPCGTCCASGCGGCGALQEAVSGTRCTVTESGTARELARALRSLGAR